MSFIIRINATRPLACTSVMVAAMASQLAAAPVGFDDDFLTQNEELYMNGGWTRESTGTHAWGTLGGTVLTDQIAHWDFDVKVIAEATVGNIDIVTVRMNVKHMPGQHGHLGGGRNQVLEATVRSIPPASQLPNDTDGWDADDWNDWWNGGRQVVDTDDAFDLHARHMEMFDLKLAADLVWTGTRFRLGRYNVTVSARHSGLDVPAPSAAMVLPAMALIGVRRRRGCTDRII